MALTTFAPDQFVAFLEAQGIQRFYIVYDRAQGKAVPSHAALQPLADFFNADKRDFNTHEGVFVQISPLTKVLQGAFVHRTCRGAAAGGVRNWHYDSIEDYLRDGLRLARGMTHKNALAGLWWGGGKGVMARNSGQGLQNGADTKIRRDVYEDYGRFMSTLRGCYVTAEDAGTSVEDMAAIFSQTRFTSCIPPSLGGSGNPSVPTARGIVRGMEAALEYLGKGSLEGKVVVVQGVGHVGKPLVEFLLQKNVARIIGSDIDPEIQKSTEAEFKASGKYEFVLKPRGDNSILFLEGVDIVSPCAVGGILSPETIPKIKAPIVCGAANNQLADPLNDGALFQTTGAVYIPDFLVNRMGIVNCADEQYGYVTNDELFERHLGNTWDNSIYKLALEVLQQAKTKNTSTQQVSLELAEARSLVPHPIWGHRGVKIIESLVAGDWQK